MQPQKNIFWKVITAVFFAAVFLIVFWNMKNSEKIFVEPDIPQKNSSTLIGLIVPHHDPVSFLTREALSQVHFKPDLIILIGPNHFEAGKSPRIVGQYQSLGRKKTPVFASKEMNELVSQNIVVQDDSVITQEHAIGVPLPFIQEKFGSTPILPIILKYHQNAQDIERLVNALVRLSDNKNILIIGSIDFSHYISSDIAPLRDAETKQYIEKRDYQKIATLSNEYLDSPWSLITLLQYLGKREVIGERLIAHTNTGLVAGMTIESSTSFLTYIFE